MLDWLKGKKTYIVAAGIFAAYGLSGLGFIVPEWVYGMLGALGLGAIRAGVAKK